ncbi:MAG TPA: ribosome biogenesis GTP-binding protein YihA/YsxC [Tissierellaceae bacterium]|nr:ribosome biogenesis GTP-binding protein YihA/YsxC [Tissierellaceae bacterium]
MRIIKADLQRVAVKPEQYPEDRLPEIAFAGRSNVGKSSLINTLVNRRGLARTSGKPGKTRTINFYIVNDEFRLVDLPGYGYARVSKKEQEKWGHIINEYLSIRENLVEVILIVDIRHQPTQQDVMMYEWIKSFGYSGIVIATKADKISRGKRHRHENMVRQKLGIKDPQLVIPFSATDRLNKDKILKAIDHLLR